MGQSFFITKPGLEAPQLVTVLLALVAVVELNRCLREFKHQKLWKVVNLLTNSFVSC